MSQLAWGSVAPSLKQQKVDIASISTACQNVKTVKKTPQRPKQCQCVAEKHTEFAQGEKSIEAYKKHVQWVVKYYENKLSKAELKKDPFMIMDASGAIYEFANNCVDEFPDQVK